MSINTMYNNSYMSLVVCLFILGCNSGPKVITANSENDSTKSETGIFTDQSDHSGHDHSKHESSSNDNDVHSVIVKEVLPTTRYVYLKVNEKNEDFWIATTKKEVKVGEAYFYRGGLLKKNFVSQEHNRTFDQIYLVSSIVKANHGNDSEPTATPVSAKKSSGEKIIVEGSVKIADIVANPEMYSDKTIQVSGRCTKVNKNIMDRHWIHLQDGSKDSYDFVITSTQTIPEGHSITMSGKISLNKDFGAGYKYDIIMEDGKILK